MRYFFFLTLLLSLSCKPAETKLTAQQIIDKTIAFSGSDKVSKSIISFNFRDKSYQAKRNDGLYYLVRYTDSMVDVLDNDGFKRFINQEKVKVADTIASKYANSINSVHYFSVLPFGLNDKAVHKKLLPSSTINGIEYYKVEISFSENGGGEDYEDVFIYWIGKDDFLINYLAYSYHTNGGGKRFRVLKEQCVKNGIRFVDYHNYKPLNNNTLLVGIDKSFEKNELKKVSEIVLKNIEVEFID